jgi:hypothetical protein
LPKIGSVAIAVLKGSFIMSRQEPDPWVGTYRKYEKYYMQKVEQLGTVQMITITKEGDGYSLGRAYSGRRFREIKKGVLSDGPGGYGKIYLGSAEYADGMKVPILRVEFCYERFELYRDKPLAPR